MASPKEGGPVLRSMGTLLALAIAALVGMAAPWVTAETYVVPVVVSGVPGLAGSFWDSEVRITKLSHQGAVGYPTSLRIQCP